jgi:phage shock protein E
MATIATVLLALLLATTGRAQVPANAVWIDVRTPAEYATGHLDQAHLIPFDKIEAGITGLHLAKDTPIYLYCAAGGRAEKAKQSLLRQGYTDVTNAGGLDSARQLLAGEAPH